MKPSELPGTRSLYRLTNRALIKIRELWQYAGEDELPPDSLLQAHVEAVRILRIDVPLSAKRQFQLFCSEHFHGLVDILDIDILMRLHLCERADTVAQLGSRLEIERFARILHGLRQTLLHGTALSRQKIMGFRHQLGIGGLRDPAHARRRAALDLEEQARPRPVLEIAV